ncbi:MAG: hypothetical protein WCT12_10165 [Verrucomicrobiota bacterium]
MGARKCFPGYFGPFGLAQGRHAVAEGQLAVAGPARNHGHSRQDFLRARNKSPGRPSFHSSGVVCRYSGDFSATVGTALAFVAKVCHWTKPRLG